MRHINPFQHTKNYYHINNWHWTLAEEGHRNIPYQQEFCCTFHFADNIKVEMKLDNSFPTIQSISLCRQINKTLTSAFRKLYRSFSVHYIFAVLYHVLTVSWKCFQFLQQQRIKLNCIIPQAESRSKKAKQISLLKLILQTTVTAVTCLNYNDNSPRHHQYV